MLLEPPARAKLKIVVKATDLNNTIHYKFLMLLTFTGLAFSDPLEELAVSGFRFKLARSATKQGIVNSSR